MSRRFTATVALCGVLSVGLAGCSGSADLAVSGSPSGAVLVQNQAHLTPEEFANAVRVIGTVIIDIRPPAEYAKGHLPGAVNVDSSSNFIDSMKQYKKGTKLALYGQDGTTSAEAMKILAANKYTAMYDLEGGFDAWKEAGGEVVEK